MALDFRLKYIAKKWFVKNV